MAMTRRITKAVYDKLSDELKKEYKLDADEKNATLDLTDYEDPAELRRAKDREAQDARDLRTELRETKSALEALQAKDGKGNKDIETLERSWQEKLDAEKAKLQTRLDKLTRDATDGHRGALARDLANKLSTDPDIILPHIERRIQVELNENDERVTKILDADGKISAKTLSELESDILADKRFSRILKGSNASGGSADRTGGREQNGSGGGAGGRSGTNPNQSPDLSKMKPAELAAYLAENKPGA